MLSKLTFPKSGEYKTGTLNEPIHFFADVLPESRQFDILLGYFSASAIRVLAIGFTKFLVQGGKGRFIINHILSEQDKTAIILGNTADERIFDFSIQHYEHLKKSLDSFGHHFFNCLAWLIASKKIQIVAIRPKNGGISHYKSGVFTDGTHEVSFKGSCNFTGTALLSNLEELDVSLSWNNSEKETAVIANQKKYFNQIFDKKAPFVEYIPFEAIEIAIQKDFGNKNINELLANEADLIAQQHSKLAGNPKLRQRFAQLEQEIKALRLIPRFPYKEGARPYQVEAYQNWLKNDKKGIFAMATGTGKTITALNCVLEACKKHPKNGYHALVLVPTIALIKQWEAEIKKFNFQTIVVISTKENWKERLSRILLLGDSASCFIVCSYSTFYRPTFQHYFKDLPKDTIFIADEAHNLGSPNVAALLPKIVLPHRIGLSATPKRLYDVEGTAAIEAFFKDQFPYRFNFSIETAIAAGFLCNYTYYPHLVTLTDNEFKKYIELSKKLMPYFNFQTGTYKESDSVFRLLLARKRVIQKAENKLAIAKNVLQKRFESKGHLKYAFVFVPEGESAKDSDTTDENEDDFKLIEQYVHAIAAIHPSIVADTITSKTPNRNTVLQYFETGKIHVLASMKCLDEGVDIPRTELAVFCASTGNPRQFIQRRGRVLRTHKDKHLAEIHDLIVVPLHNQVVPSENTFLMEKSLVKKELERVAHFAFLSLNPYEAISILETVCQYYELDLFAIQSQIHSH